MSKNKVRKRNTICCNPTEWMTRTMDFIKQNIKQINIKYNSEYVYLEATNNPPKPDFLLQSMN